MKGDESIARVECAQDRAPELGTEARGEKPGHSRLGELSATAICGNDITSSCLYVSALAVVYAGKWGPVALVLVAGVLYLFRAIYAEVVGALPLNGGAYNALLNTTSKFRASVAGCLTILSYMATAVISANEAMHYAHGLWSGLPVIGATAVLLAAFAGVTILGISESARVAVAIFLIHLTTLSILLLAGVIKVAQSGVGMLAQNLSKPAPHDVGTALLFGFSAAMLGISGFESSANFVEEQAEGVFPKTLRNMWAAVSVFNPGMALLALALVPVTEVGNQQEALLAHMGGLAGGPWLHWLVSVDAVLVLSGAVLTSFVGVNGLVHRMTLDRCLPAFLLRVNRRDTTHRIILGFLALCVSVLLITGGELRALAGVYTLSFLTVMTLFAVGNVLLKVRRKGLRRPERAPWPVVIVAILAVTVALAGNAVMNPPYLIVFLEYFVPAVAIVSIMLGRIALLEACLFVMKSALTTLGKRSGDLASAIRRKIEQINSQQVVFFTRGDHIANLNRAMLYVAANEHTNRIKVVTVAEEPDEIPAKISRDLAVLDEIYPEIDIEFVHVPGRFGPDLITRLSREWRIPKNLMFIGSPGGRLPFSLAELGGVRLII